MVGPLLCGFKGPMKGLRYAVAGWKIWKEHTLGFRNIFQGVTRAFKSVKRKETCGGGGCWKRFLQANMLLRRPENDAKVWRPCVCLLTFDIRAINNKKNKKIYSARHSKQTSPGHCVSKQLSICLPLRTLQSSLIGSERIALVYAYVSQTIENYG